MNERPRASTALVLLGLATTATGCGPSNITAPRLESSVAQNFARLYVHQQDLVGHQGLDPVAVESRADCRRPATLGDGLDSGAGPWVCTVRWTAVDGTPAVADYEIQAKAPACYMATGPETVVGSPWLRTSTGETAYNPIAGFDGCFPFA